MRFISNDEIIAETNFDKFNIVRTVQKNEEILEEV